MKSRSQPLLAATILPAALLLTQCATPTATSPATLVAGGHWVRVSSHPPTFYPRGVAASCPTDCHSGEWVHTADAQGSRFFIPIHQCGIPHKTLLHEALSARSEKLVRQIAAEDRDYMTKKVLANVIAAPILVPALGLAAGL